ncbi:MAG: glycoside hydrolase family 127 protein [Bacteroidia bacterium]|nr:glycoside hydrolase family 127 protein [Bacteroidia bacterium]
MNSILKLAFSFFLCLEVCLINFNSNGQISPAKDYPIQPVSFTKVKVTDHFWAPRIELNQKVTIPIALDQCYKTGRVENFKIAAKLTKGKFQSEYPFDDSDIYKIIEGASYSLQTNPDARLEMRIDTLIQLIGLAQEPDGYLYTTRTIDSLHMHPWAGKKRWENDPKLSHELYNLGHLYEAAYAHYLATGKRTLLDVALKSANLVDHDFGPGKLSYYPGHQVIEMGLSKLYRITGDERYLKLAKFFLDCRKGGDEYNQAHKPVIEQDKIVGHAVRATYMYAGMADVSALTGDNSYKNATDKIWNDLISTKYYVTGGIGSGGSNEGFSDPYFLPNMSAYCETCASISNVMWNQRMFLLEGNSKFYDVLERTLYNALLSGISLSADRFFYPNPLESHGQHTRSAWFGCACCPSNICRFIPSVPGYIYAKKGNDLYVNLFMNNSAMIDLGGERLNIEQTTDYPWKGEISIRVNPGKERVFSMMIRIPGWAVNQAVPSDLYHFKSTDPLKVGIKVNGRNFNYEVKNGYASISRKWKNGDQLFIDLPMPVREITANQLIKDDIGKVALQRGPLIYCAEWPDNKNGHVLNLYLNPQNIYSTEYLPNLLNGVTIIKTTVNSSSQLENKTSKDEKQLFTAIPYYAWANRGKGEMTVWIPLKANK